MKTAEMCVCDHRLGYPLPHSSYQIITHLHRKTCNHSPTTVQLLQYTTSTSTSTTTTTKVGRPVYQVGRPIVGKNPLVGKEGVKA